MLVLGIGGIVGLIVLSGWFTWRLAQQHARITGWSPVTAQIEVSRALTQSVGRSSRYWPGITYRYSVAGKNYRCDRALPSPREGAAAWAQAIVDRFPVGSQATAYVNPANPSEAFLLPQTNPMDCVIAAVPWVGVGLLLGWVIGGPRDARSRRAAEAEPADGSTEGWHSVPPVIGRRSAVRRQAAVVVAMLPSVPYWAHLAAYGPFDRFDQYLWPAGCLGVLAVAGWTLWRQWRDAGAFGDAIVLVRPWPVRAGEPLEVKVSAPVHVPAPTAQITVSARGFTLTKVSTGKGSRIAEAHAWSADAGASAPLAPGAPARGDVVLAIPAAAPASGLEVPRAYPASRSGLVVTVRAGDRTTAQSHVLRVEPASGGQ